MLSTFRVARVFERQPFSWLLFYFRNHPAVTAAVVIVFLVASSVVAITVKKKTDRTVKSAGAASVQREPNQPGEILVLQLRAGGFVPREISRTAGEYMILVNNVSGEPDVTVRVSRFNGNKLHELRLQRGRQGRQLMRLTPGSYLVSVAEFPSWGTSQITITNQ